MEQVKSVEAEMDAKVLELVEAGDLTGAATFIINNMRTSLEGKIMVRDALCHLAMIGRRKAEAEYERGKAIGRAEAIDEIACG